MDICPDRRWEKETTVDIRHTQLHRNVTVAFWRRFVKKSSQVTLVPTWNPRRAYKKQQLSRPQLPLRPSPFKIFLHTLNALESHVLCLDYVIITVEQSLKSTALSQRTPQSEDITDVSITSRFGLLEKTPILNYKYLHFSGYTGTPANVFCLSQLSGVNALRLNCQFQKWKTKYPIVSIYRGRSDTVYKICAILIPCDTLWDSLPSPTGLLHQHCIQNEIPNPFLNKGRVWKMHSPWQLSIRPSPKLKQGRNEGRRDQNFFQRELPYFSSYKN